MLLVYVTVATLVSYAVAKNAKNIGYGFWRSFIFLLLLFAVVLAFLAKQFG